MAQQMVIGSCRSWGRSCGGFNDYLVSHFQSALAQGRFHIVYQPLVRLSTGMVSSFEALVRWNDPCYGLLKAGLFVPVLERARRRQVSVI